MTDKPIDFETFEPDPTLWQPVTADLEGVRSRCWHGVPGTETEGSELTLTIEPVWP